MKVCVIGGGWAGLAAAVQATQQGHQVTLIEATRHWGGRARALTLQATDGTSLPLDNGQHILIGAYTATLGLMETVGVDLSQALLDLPLGLPYPDGQGMSTPPWAARWPAPLDALAAMFTARGWSWHDRLALMQRSLRWRLSGFQCPPGDTVADVCRGLPARPMRDLIEPLCVSALNLPAAQASGQVFLRVLRDALFGQGHRTLRPAHLLIPRQDLGSLMPAKAVDWLRAHGATTQTGTRATALRPGPGGWDITLRADGLERTGHADQVVLATSAEVAGQLDQLLVAVVKFGQLGFRDHPLALLLVAAPLGLILLERDYREGRGGCLGAARSSCRRVPVLILGVPPCCRGGSTLRVRGRCVRIPQLLAPCSSPCTPGERGLHPLVPSRITLHHAEDGVHPLVIDRDFFVCGEERENASR